MVGVFIPQLSVITSTHFPLRELVVKNFISMGVGFPCGSIVKNPPANAGDWVPSLGWEDPLEKKQEPTPVFLQGKSHGQRRLMGYSP